jgi:prevent-host-death family protein
MHTFNIRDLRQRTGQLVRDAESGELSLVTKYGRPVFVAVPMSGRLLEHGVHQALAIKLFADRVLSLSKAARLADLPVERFLQALAAAGVDAVDYPPEELDQELEHFA